MWSFITNPIITHALAVVVGVLTGWWTTIKAKAAAADEIAKSDWEKFKAAAKADIADIKKL
jgi:hypothetical protein